MATTTTRTAFRRALMDELREYGPKPGLGIGIYFTAATIAATSFTTVDHRLHSSDWQANAVRGWKFYNDPATANEVRTANAHSVTTGTATVTTYGANMTTASAKVCELWHPMVDPDEVNRILADALNMIWTPYRTLLTIGPVTDHDQAASGTTAWTGSAGTTLGKITASAPNNVPLLGYQSLRVQSDSVNDYAESGALLLPPSAQFRLVGFARSATGNSVLRLQGPSASLDSITNAGETGFVFFDKQIATSTGGSHTFRLENSSATGDSYWGAVGLQPTGRGTFALPSWVDNNHKLQSVEVASFHNLIGTDYYDAREYSLRPFKGYRYESTTFGANPHRMELTEYPNGPLFITGSRTHYDIGEVLATEAATTSADLPYVLAAAKYLMGKRYPELLPGLERKYAKEFDAMTVLRRQPDVEEPAVRMVMR